MTDLLDVLTEVRRDAEEGSRRAYELPRSTGVAPTWGSELSALATGGLRTTLLDRRSRRFFRDQPVELADLRAAATAGTEIDAVLWPEPARRQPLEVVVAARAVIGLDPAIYVFRDGPVRLADLPSGDGLAGMVLQPEFAQAAALLVVTGSLADAIATDGSHGHRRLLERSGAVAETIWLAAVRRGLGGSIFAGFLPSALRSLAGVDGFRRTQLLAVALGHPLDSAEPDAVSATG